MSFGNSARPISENLMQRIKKGWECVQMESYASDVDTMWLCDIGGKSPMLVKRGKSIPNSGATSLMELDHDQAECCQIMSIPTSRKPGSGHAQKNGPWMRMVCFKPPSAPRVRWPPGTDLLWNGLTSLSLPTGAGLTAALALSIGIVYPVHQYVGQFAPPYFDHNIPWIPRTVALILNSRLMLAWSAASPWPVYHGAVCLSLQATELRVWWVG